MNSARIQLDNATYEFEPYDVTVSSSLDGYEFSMRAWNLLYKTEEEVISKEEAQASFGNTIYPGIYPNTIPYETKTDTKITLTPSKEDSPELYKDDLKAIIRLLDSVEKIANDEAVFDVEVRVRLYGDNTWIVLGYGETGDPAVIRFE